MKEKCKSKDVKSISQMLIQVKMDANPTCQGMKLVNHTEHPEVGGCAEV